MKIGIIRCGEFSNTCSGYDCFLAIQNKTGEFKRYDTIELIGFDICGGCGRSKPDKIVARALRLKEHGAEVIHLATCLVRMCPFKKIYETAIKEKTGLSVIRGTHLYIHNPSSSDIAQNASVEVR